jgi:hypothetical protein
VEGGGSVKAITRTASAVNKKMNSDLHKKCNDIVWSVGQLQTLNLFHIVVIQKLKPG